MTVNTDKMRSLGRSLYWYKEEGAMLGKAAGEIDRLRAEVLLLTEQRDAARALACEIHTACTEKQPESISEEIDSWGDGPWNE